MSDRDQDLIAAVRRAYEAFNRGDFDSVIHLVDLDFELVTDLTSLRGAERFRAWMEPVTMGSVSVETRSFEATGNHVLVGQHARGRGLASGISVQTRSWAVWTFNDAGLATRFAMFRDSEEFKAREAAGLSE